MTTAIVGVGNIGSAVARHLVAGGEPVVLTAKDESGPQGAPGENRTPPPAPPHGESSGPVVAALLPAGAHYVKAFGTLGADALAASANRDPLAVLFYATHDDTAAITIERLIRAAGFEPWKAGGVAAAGRIEAPSGDLHQYGFNGEVVDIDRARP